MPDHLVVNMGLKNVFTIRVLPFHFQVLLNHSHFYPPVTPYADDAYSIKNINPLTKVEPRTSLKREKN